MHLIRPRTLLVPVVILVATLPVTAQRIREPSGAPAGNADSDARQRRLGVAEAGRPSGPGSVSGPRGDASPRQGDAKFRGEGESSVIREPSQGRPVFIKPGETFYFVMRLPAVEKGDEVSFSLRHGAEPSIRIPLRPTTPMSYVNDEYCSLLLEAPARTQPGLYDLVVTTRGHHYDSKNSVKVLDRFKTQFRFVHLSNMNVGDLTAPQFDERLPDELNLLAPEFIIATGDYTEWARARDDAASWIAVLEYFGRFEAPVFMLCGQHDHEASFSRFVAKDPIGVIDYGGYHGLLLLDHPGNPIEQDYSQLQWIESDLKRNKPKFFSFIACNSDELGLIDVWREAGKLAQLVEDNKLKMFITGGSCDWDYREFAAKLRDIPGVEYVRTHQSSTALRDRATGVSHYRVIEVDGDKVSTVYADDTATERLAHSIPAGKLRVYYDAPNDGSSHRVTATILNALNRGFKDTRVWLRVAKTPGQPAPSVGRGRLVTALDAGSHWACEVRIDLPDKGAVKVCAASLPDEIVPALPIDVALEGNTDWEFTEQRTDFGMSFFESRASAALRLTNRAGSTLACWPVVRVNGTQLFADRNVVQRMPITLEPGKSVSVPLILRLRRVSPGPHALQVHFLEDPLSRLHTFEVNLSQHGGSQLSAAPIDGR